ncbi:MAG: hypothetical protein NZ572_07985, partial [Thermoflexus sp.]|nr:hypothetical protein [Thermoflexus sp.]
LGPAATALAEAPRWPYEELALTAMRPSAASPNCGRSRPFGQRRPTAASWSSPRPRVLRRR